MWTRSISLWMGAQERSTGSAQKGELDGPCCLFVARLSRDGFWDAGGQDDHLLESPSSINFLIRFCKPIVSNTTEDKAPKVGRKLLALRLGADISHCAPKRLDSSSAAILSKVHEILVACKELKPSCADDGQMSKPELSPKWIALLTMEKACLSTISLEGLTLCLKLIAV